VRKQSQLSARPVVYLFAGPNGSGKSSVFAAGRSELPDVAVFVNADELNRLIRQLDPSLTPDESNLRAAQTADVMRYALLDQRVTFATESVLSDVGRWTRFFDAVQDAGFELALVFVTTCDPEINVARVADRVAKGGHNVPPDKVRKRYKRTMERTLPIVFKRATYAQLFDNSATEPRLVIEKEAGRVFVASDAPDWAKKLASQ